LDAFVKTTCLKTTNRLRTRFSR